MTDLVLDGVTKRYGDVTAVDEVDLRIGPGEFRCLVGPNGSGKTTVFELLVGLRRPTDGAVRAPADAVGCGFQTPTTYPDLTVAENLRTFGDIAGVDQPWVATVRDDLGLDRVADRSAGALSGGWGKLLDVALAFVPRPRYVLLDEPLDNLDDAGVERVLSFAESYRNGDRTVVVSTHDLTAFEAHVDRLTVMDRGTVVFDEHLSGAPPDGHDSWRSFYVDLVTDDASGSPVARQDQHAEPEQ